jgi:hypothetical protein
MADFVFVVATVCTQKCGKQREGATQAGTCRGASLTLRFTFGCLFMESSASMDCIEHLFERSSLM